MSHPWRTYLPVMILLLVLLIMMFGVRSLWYHTMDYEVTGLNFNISMSEDEIEVIHRVIDQMPSVKGGASLESISLALSACPWLEVNQLSMQWPNRVWVDMSIKPLMAFWGPEHVVDHLGYIHSLNLIPKDHQDVLPMILPNGKLSVEMARDIIDCIANQGYEVAAIESLGLDSLVLTLDNLPDVRVRLSHACSQVNLLPTALKMLEDRGKKLSQIPYIDMRYKRAFSIGKHV